MDDCYKRIGATDDQVTGVAWRGPHLLPVAQGTFETWIIRDGSAHGVRFTHAVTAARYAGDANDVYAIAWVDRKGEQRFTRDV